MTLTPSSSHGGGAAEPPFTIPDTGTVPIVKDESGDTLLSMNADTGLNKFLGTVDGTALGATFAYATVQAGAPSTYVTPIVVDTTAVTGATYAWNSEQYVKIADLLT